MKQLKAQLQEALATGRLIARFGKSLFVLAIFMSTLNAIAPLLIILGYFGGSSRNGTDTYWLFLWDGWRGLPDGRMHSALFGS